MIGKVRLKTITIFLMVAGANCGDFLDELKSSLDKLQETVDKISLEQIKTNKKVDQLEEKLEKLGRKVITVEDLKEVNNNVSYAIDQLKNEIMTFRLEKYSENDCNKAETNVADIANGKKDETNLTEDHIDALNHDKEVEEKGKIIFGLPT